MSKDEQTVERVARAMAFDRRSPLDASEDDNDFWAHTGEQAKDDWRGTARAAISAMQKDAAMDRLVAEGQRCDAMTPQEAAKVSAEARENIVDEIESIICETHEMDVRDIDYAENIVSWLERHHPAALRAISEDSQ